MVKPLPYVYCPDCGKEVWFCRCPDTEEPVEAVEDRTNPKDLLGVKKPSTAFNPATALLHWSMAQRDGGIKYGPFNWREKDVLASVYLAAMDRHKMLWEAGEKMTSDTRVHHLGAIMACCAILIDAEENGRLIDDRPVCYRVRELMDELEQQIKEEVRDEHGRVVP